MILWNKALFGINQKNFLVQTNDHDAAIWALHKTWT